MELFSHPTVGMLHPFLDGAYPGICANLNPSVAPLVKSLTTTQHEPIDDGGDDEYQDGLDTDIDVNMDDILDEPTASMDLLDGAGEDWIEEDSRKFHKSSLLHVMFCSSFMRKSKECLQRVRAYTVDFKKPSDEEYDQTLLDVPLRHPWCCSEVSKRHSVFYS